MCEGALTESILTGLIDLIETSGITKEEFVELMWLLRYETVQSLITGISAMNKHNPETYQDMLKESRKVDDIWRIDVDEAGYFTVKE